MMQNAQLHKDADRWPASFVSSTLLLMTKVEN